MKNTKNLVITTLIVGSLDALAAMVQFFLSGGRNFANIFKFIASGIYGKTAFKEGVLMTTFGVLCHYLIAFIWVLLFFKLYAKIVKSPQNIYLIGALYGLFIWGVMNAVVIPLSRVSSTSNTFLEHLIAALILVVFVGLPIVIRYAKSFPNHLKK